MKAAWIIQQISYDNPVYSEGKLRENAEAASLIHFPFQKLFCKCISSCIIYTFSVELSVYIYYQICFRLACTHLKQTSKENPKKIL